MTSATDGLNQVTNRLAPFGEPVVVIASPSIPASGGWLTARVTLLALVVLGVGLRTIPLVQNRNLWIDEAMLALNLVERSPAQLLAPLDWNQGAPAGFLLSVKAAIMAFGEAEWALRLVPFIGSLLGFFAFVWLARHMLPGVTATLAITLYAIAPHLVSYSAECKQYATDASLTIALFAVACGLFQGAGGFRRWAVLAGVGAIAVWFSHPIAFVLGGIGTALFADAVWKRDRTRALACCTAIGCWLVSFGTCYVLFVKQLGTNQYLLDYWAGHFMPMPPLTPGAFAWLADHYFGIFAYPGGLGGSEVKSAGVAALLFVVGIASFWRDRWPVAVALVLPAVLALLASGLNKYPFAGRLVLFLVPVLILGVARGAGVVGSALWSKQPLAAVAVIGLLLLAPAVESYQMIRRPLRTEQLTEVLADLRTRMRPEDQVYLYYGGIPSFLYYSRRETFPANVTLGSEYRDRRTGYRDELMKFVGEPRVWVVFSHRHQAEESLLRAYSEGIGECQEEIHRPGATAFLYDFRGPRHEK